jgi:hypothetical protein
VAMFVVSDTSPVSREHVPRQRQTPLAARHAIPGRYRRR